MNEKHSDLNNSYLTFRLGNEVFAVSTNKVLNILEMCRITEVPKAPEYMLGIINLRGSILPVIDLRKKLELSSTSHTASTCIIVIDFTIDGESVLVGGVVDAVQAVLEFEISEILPPPSIGNKYRNEFITGIYKFNDSVIMILDVDSIFSTDELSELKGKSEGNFKNELV